MSSPYEPRKTPRPEPPKLRPAPYPGIREANEQANRRLERMREQREQAEEIRRAARLASARDAALERLKEWYAARGAHNEDRLAEAVRALLAAEAEGA